MLLDVVLIEEKKRGRGKILALFSLDKNGAI